tara:strand:- start:346 stop:1203 length:858 start_codon:yes stop_codon:yes gene_type:complete
MATLSGNAIKDSYQGLLKTSDNAAISSSLKTIQDGAGNDTGISLSSTTLRASSLEINSATRSGSTNVLVWDSSSKSVGFRTLPTFESVTATVTGATDPTLTISDSGGNSTAIVFEGGQNVDVTQSSNTITINANQPDVKIIQVSGTTELSTSDSGKSIFLRASVINGGTIKVPSAAAGLTFKFFIYGASTTQFNIQTQSGDSFFGRIDVASTTDDQRAVQVVTEVDSRATPTSFDNIYIDSNSATTGGSDGDFLEVTALSSSLYLVTGTLTTSAANPSSIATIAG